MKYGLKTVALAIVACAALAFPASAAFVVNPLVGGVPTGNIYDNLNDLPLGGAGGVTSTGIAVSLLPDAKVVTGASAGFYAAPFLSSGNGALFGDANGADTSHYITTGSTGAFANAAAEMLLPVWSNYLGLLWGSVDLYNTLMFYDGAVLVGSITGSDVNAVANGDQGANGTFYVNITSDTLFNRIVAKSSRYAFEFDNIAYKEVPEPMSLALLGLGLAGLGYANQKSGRRRNALITPLN